MPEPVRISVRVQPRSSRNEVVGFDATGVLRIRVNAPPVDGAANRAVVDLLAAALGIPRSNIMIAAGQNGRQKLIGVAGMTETEIRRRLESD